MREDTLETLLGLPPLHPDAPRRAQRLEAGARHAASGVLGSLYAVPRLGPFCLRLCTKLEGGPFFSQTLRDILRTVHGVEIGRYSYGDILKPALMPKGSRVGAYCSVGTNLIVRRRDHPTTEKIMHPFFYNSALGFLECDSIALDEDNPLEIGHDVWIGDRVTILGGCKAIGNGAVIAAGAVVTRDVAPYSIVGGVPAKHIKTRLPVEDIAALEESRWWKKSLPEIIEQAQKVG